jgi:hypothetical protein
LTQNEEIFAEIGQIRTHRLGVYYNGISNSGVVVHRNLDLIFRGMERFEAFAARASGCTTGSRSRPFADEVALKKCSNGDACFRIL